MFHRVFLAAIFALTLASASFAHHDKNHGESEIAAAIGPVIDAPAPTFSGLNAQGEAITLEDVAGSEGTILVFVRSADWCPFCKRQLIELSENAETLKAQGWQVVGLSYDTPEKLAKFSAKSDITYPLVSDTDSATIIAFGLLNEEVGINSRSYGIPHPAIVFIDAEGTVKAVLREEGYRKRPEIEQITETVTALSAN